MKRGEWWGWGADDVQIDEAWSRMDFRRLSSALGGDTVIFVEMMMDACFSETG
jgi:hypothetical protein